MKLFYYPHSAPCRAVWLLCLEAHVPFELVKIDVQNSEHLSAKFTELNPTHTLPVIQDKKFVLFRSETILRYIAGKWKHEQWYPTALVERVKVDLYLDWHISELVPVSSAVLELETGYKSDFTSIITDSGDSSGGGLGERDDKVTAVAMKGYIDALNVLETLWLDKSQYIAGDTITIADLNAVTEISLHRLFSTDLEKTFPKLWSWYNRVIGQIEKSWKLVNADYDAFVKTTNEQKKKRQDKQASSKKHGKDAKGGQKPPDISHTVYFQTPPHEVFVRLTDAAQLSKYTGTSCTFSATNGGKFSYGDANVGITGINLYLMQDAKLLQSWRSNEWPPSHSSTVKVSLEKLESGTVLQLDQLDVPEAFIKKTDEWWQNVFWKPLDGVLTRNIIQQVFFDNMSPHEIYEMLMDSTKLTKFSKLKCEMGRGVGSAFDLFDTMIVGKNVELITDAKIVQKWRQHDWPNWHFSTVTMEIKRVTGGTDLILTQVDVPVDKYRAVSESWEKNFWKKMKTFK